MDVRTCQRCKKIFNYVTGQPVCASCKKELEILFKDVRSFIRRNPQASIQEVADECKVDSKQIKQWIREERLSFTSDSAVGIECERCGKSIKTGRFCEECKKETLNELQSVQREHNSDAITNEQENTGRKSQMRFLNKDR